MQSKLRTILICIAGVGLGAQAYAATPQNGVVNITGKVTEKSCVLDSTATTVSVNLPPVNKDLLSAAQSSAGRGGFSLKVTGCGDGVKVSAGFVPGTNVDPHGNLKNNAATDPASSVQVQVLDKNHRVININTDDATTQLARAETVSGTTPANLQYYVQYYSQAGGAGAGAVAATANFQLTYE
ncbi:fimbrial protein [Comamonas testosteroni]|uniref:fimbrial protein n=1 Tax=Comamonas testosteroni TaxID=285 RepID=UPI00265EE453|nr:fimbrial protein [Comamonas testosteroni]WKL14492.1 fimbrial protein [Comamonas testosteroni]